jgi:hypothetical protein
VVTSVPLQSHDIEQEKYRWKENSTKEKRQLNP